MSPNSHDRFAVHRAAEEGRRIWLCARQLIALYEEKAVFGTKITKLASALSERIFAEEEKAYLEARRQGLQPASPKMHAPSTWTRKHSIDRKTRQTRPRPYRPMLESYLQGTFLNLLAHHQDSRFVAQSNPGGSLARWLLAHNDPAVSAFLRDRVIGQPAASAAAMDEGRLRALLAGKEREIHALERQVAQLQAGVAGQSRHDSTRLINALDAILLCPQLSACLELDAATGAIKLGPGLSCGYQEVVAPQDLAPYLAWRRQQRRECG